MCSTPRPKTKVRGKSGTSGGLLSSLSAESRSAFAERANIAQERRDQIALELKQDKDNASMRTALKTKTRDVNNSQSQLGYWLFKASLKDIFTTLFFNTSKRA